MLGGMRAKVLGLVAVVSAFTSLSERRVVNMLEGWLPSAEDLVSMSTTSTAVRSQAAASEPPEQQQQQQQQVGSSSNTTSGRPWAALCAVMKDEDKYITEWSLYHLGIGFKRVYVADSHPNYTLANWTEGMTNPNINVSHVVLPKNGPVQEKVYNNCANELRALPDPPKWVMFLDGDEFLVLRNGGKKNYTTVTDFLEDHVKRGALQISWLVFGTGNQTNYTAEPVTKRFKYRLDEPAEQTKTVVVLDHLREVVNPHYVNVKKGYKSVAIKDKRPANRAGARCCLPPHRRDTSVVAVHHYKTKSYEEFYYKSCVRGRIYKHVTSKCKEVQQPIIGEVYDDVAWEALKRNVPKYAVEYPDDETNGATPTTSRLR